MRKKLPFCLTLLLIFCCLTCAGCYSGEKAPEPPLPVGAAETVETVETAENVETVETAETVGAAAGSLSEDGTLFPAGETPAEGSTEENAPDGAESRGEPGFFWVDGTLYCRDEEGILLRDTEKDGLYFSGDGAYTSGSEKLDALVSEKLAELIDGNPGCERAELLRKVYDSMVSDRYSYLGIRADAKEGEPWETEPAIVMLETGRGNCHYYAAAFWALARGLGYPAITHTNPSGQRHSWTEIEIDSVRYVFDPQLAVHWKDDRFMLSYERCRQKEYTVYFNEVTSGY